MESEFESEYENHDHCPLPIDADVGATVAAITDLVGASRGGAS